MKTNKNIFCDIKHGFTLIELVVTLAILGIVLTTIFSVNLFGIRTFAQSSDKAVQQFEVRMPTDFIAKKARYANQMEILTSVPTSTPPGAHEIFLDNGQIKYREYGSDSSIVGTQGVTDYTLTMQRKSTASNVLQFTIGKSGTDKYDLITDVIVLNIGSLGISGNQQGIGIRFYTTSSDSVTPVSISSLVSPPVQYANIGSSVTMPLRITANMSDGTTRQVSVRWTPSTIDSSTAGIRSSVGKVVGYNDTITFSVVVAAYSIVSVENISMTVYKNQPFSMPTTVVASYSDGVTSFMQNVPITWDSIINTSSTGQFEAKGTVAGWAGEVTILVEVLDRYIVSIDDLEMSVHQGSSFELPANIPARYSDGSIQDVPVVWSGTADTSIGGVYIFSSVYDGRSISFKLTVIKQKLPTPSIPSIVKNGNTGTVRIENGMIGSTAVFKKNNGEVLFVRNIQNIVEVFNIDFNSLDHVIFTKEHWFDSDPYFFK